MPQVHTDRIGRPITVGALKALLSDWPDDAVVIARGGRPSSIQISHPGPMPVLGSIPRSGADENHTGPQPGEVGGSLLGSAGPPEVVRTSPLGGDHIDCPEDCGAAFVGPHAGDELADHLRDAHAVEPRIVEPEHGGEG